MIMRDGVESTSLRLRPASEPDLASFHSLTGLDLALLSSEAARTRDDPVRARMIMRDGVESSSLRLRPAAESVLASFHSLTKPRPRLVEQ